MKTMITMKTMKTNSQKSKISKISKNNIRKIKKIAILCVLLAFTLFLSSMLYSCTKPDIYVLVENILQNKNLNAKSPNGLYSFAADLNIKINKDYLRKSGLLPDFGKQNEELDAVPEELTFKIAGIGKNSEKNISQFIMTFELVLSAENEENQNLKTTAIKNGNRLYLELNGVSRVILDLLYSAGFIEAPVRTLFDKQVEFDNYYVLCFDLSGFDLKFFGKYSKEIEKIFTVQSNVKYYLSNNIKDFDVPEYGKNKVLYFSDIKDTIKKELLKLPDYRYMELYAVIETDKNNNSFMNILATHENGKKEILEKVKLDCDLSKVWENPSSLYLEDILPLRYLLELFGETVGWDANQKLAYTVKNGTQIFFYGPVINSKTYISILQFMMVAGYDLKSAVIDDYIEFTFVRK